KATAGCHGGVGRGCGVGRGLRGGPNGTQYLPPVFIGGKTAPIPPQMTISLPVQTAVWNPRASGALAVLVDAQRSRSGLYLPPVLKLDVSSPPPQTIIFVPVQTAV